MTYILYWFYIEKSLLCSFIYTHYPNLFLLFYCFHRWKSCDILPFFKGKSFAFVHMMFTHHLAIFNICCTTNVSEVLYMGEQTAHWWVNNASRWMWAWWTLVKWIMILLVYALGAQCIGLHRLGLGHTQESHIINNSLSNPSLAFMDWMFPLSKNTNSWF